MPTTRTQKKARKSRGQEMLSDVENLDIMLGGNHFDSEESEDSILARRPESVNCNASEKDEENLHLNAKETGLVKAPILVKILPVQVLVLSSISYQVN